MPIQTIKIFITLSFSPFSTNTYRVCLETVILLFTFSISTEYSAHNLAVLKEATFSSVTGSSVVVPAFYIF